MYLNKIIHKVQSDVKNSLTHFKVNNVKVEDKMIELFFGIIRDTLKRCAGIRNYDYYKWGTECIWFNTYDDESILIGCLEKGNFILDSEFIYKRFRSYLKKQNEIALLRDISSSFEFFKALYSQGILCNGIFWKRPLYYLSMEHDTWKRKSYFVIPADSIGYKESMINWH